MKHVRKRRKHHAQNNTSDVDTDNETSNQPLSKKPKAECQRIIFCSPGFGFHNLTRKVSIAYRTVNYQIDKGRMQYITNVLFQMIIAFTWIKYLPTALLIDDILDLYTANTLRKVGQDTLEKFVEKYNKCINMNIFPNDILLNDPSQSTLITNVEVAQYLEDICKSPHVQPFISTFKYYVGDNQYNPNGIGSGHKTFILKQNREVIYEVLERMQQYNCNAPTAMRGPISTTSINMETYISDLKMELQIQKMDNGNKDKLIKELQQQLIKLQNLSNVSKQDLIQCLQNKYENPLLLKRFVFDLVKTPQLKKAIKVIEIKPTEKQELTQQQKNQNYLLNGNRIRIALETIHGKINYQAIDGLKHAIDCQPKLICVPEDKIDVIFEKQSNNMAGRSEIIKIINRWEQAQSYYEHKYNYYKTGYDGFLWPNPHVTFPNVCGFLVNYFILLVTAEILTNRYKYHLYGKKATDSKKIPVLIGKVDGARTKYWTKSLFTLGTLSFTGQSKLSSYFNIPFFGIAGGDKINVEFIRHEFNRVNKLKFESDIVLPWQGIQHRIPIHKVPLILIMDRALLNALNYHLTCSSHTPNLYGFLFRTIAPNDKYKQLKIQRYSKNGYELVEMNKKWWDMVPTYDFIFDIHELERKDDFKSNHIISLPYEPLLMNKITDMKREVLKFYENYKFIDSDDKKKKMTEKAKEFIKEPPYEIGYYDEPLKCMIILPYIPPIHTLLRGPGDGWSKHLSYYAVAHGDNMEFVIPYLENIKGCEAFAGVLSDTIRYAPKGKYFLASTNGNVVKALCEQYGNLTYLIEENMKGKSVKELKWKQIINMTFLRKVEIVRNRLGLLMGPIPKIHGRRLKSSDPILRKWQVSGQQDFGVINQTLDGFTSPTFYAVCNLSTLVYQRFLKFKEDKNLDIEYKHLDEGNMEHDNCIMKGFFADKGNRRDMAIGTVVKYMTFFRIAGIEQMMRQFIAKAYYEKEWTYSVPNRYYDISQFCQWSQEFMWLLRRRDSKGVKKIIDEFLIGDGKKIPENIDDIYQKGKAFKYTPIKIVNNKTKNKSKSTHNQNNKRNNSGRRRNHNIKKPPLMEYD
eukprot:458762_1